MGAGAVEDPYAGGLAVWRADDPDLVLVSGRVSEWPDYLGGPATLIQPSPADRLYHDPVGFPGGTPGIEGTAATEFSYVLATTAPEVVALMNDPAASWDIEMFVTRRASPAADQVMICWGGVNTTTFGWIGFNSQHRLRYLRRAGAPAQRVVDSAATFALDVPIRLLVSLRAGLLYAWADGVQVFFGDDVATGQVGAAFQRLTIGCRWTTAAANYFPGEFSEIVLREAA